MNYIVNIAEGVFVSFKNKKELLTFAKDFTLGAILYGPFAVIVAFFIGLGICGVAALLFYLFLTHISFFIFDIPMKILESL